MPTAVTHGDALIFLCPSGSGDGGGRACLGGVLRIPAEESDSPGGQAAWQSAAA